MAAVKKTEFENCTQGYLGVVKVNRKGDPEGHPVEPGTRVFLTDEEVELTEQAVSRDAHSPFKIREIVHFDPRTGDETARFKAAPLSKVTRESTGRRKAASG
jgi:hypothetical protein